MPARGKTQVAIGQVDGRSVSPSPPQDHLKKIEVVEEQKIEQEVVGPSRGVVFPPCLQM